MGFLKTVAALGHEEEMALDTARANLVKCVLRGDRKSPQFVIALSRWRSAWKAFYGFALKKDQEKLYVDVLSEREHDAPLSEQKKA